MKNTLEPTWRAKHPADIPPDASKATPEEHAEYLRVVALQEKAFEDLKTMGTFPESEVTE